MGKRWLVLGLLALAAPTLSQDVVLERGRLVEGVQCQSDRTQTYSLYLPTAYTRERTWPALLILDPRGRSVHAAELFREAAEEYGWILLSSNDTRSDTPTGEPNARALRALWPEAQGRYATDPKRTYLAGFSGTARFAWEIGQRTDEVAGVIASGSWWERGRYDEPFPCPCYGTVGNTDFNYGPMKEVHAQLRGRGSPERLEIFEGSHTWMPAGLAHQAIEWMEIQAIKKGLRPEDEALVRRLLQEDLARAAELEAAGRLLDAQRRYAAVADTFQGLTPVVDARRETARLEALPATDRLAGEERRWDTYEESMRRRHAGVYDELRSADPPLLAAAFGMKLQIGELKEHAQAEGYEGLVGRRLLQTLGTNTGYYLSREFTRRGEHSRAAVALSVATEALPGRARFWYDLACSQARVGARRRALDALEEAVARGFTDRERMASDEDLKPLHDEARFQALVATPDEAEK